jgi:hypothetical protein
MQNFSEYPELCRLADSESLQVQPDRLITSVIIADIQQ